MGPRPRPVLGAPDRVRALSRAGLSEVSDSGMELYATRVRDRLGVPVALVSLVEPDRQVFPGMTGLSEPWATARCTPLSHSLCQYVVAGEQLLIVADTREHPWVADNLAVTELGVAAYAGMPLTDEHGLVLGSLCAIDTAPRDWTPAELEALSDLAHGCSMELRWRLSRHDAGVERAGGVESERQVRAALSRSHTLLAASQWLAEVSNVTEIRTRVAELVSTELAPTYVSMTLLGPDEMLHRVSDPDLPPGPDDAAPWDVFELTAPTPASAAVREQRVLHYSDRASLVAEWPAVTELVDDLHVGALIVAPLMAAGDAIGALSLGWDQPQAISPVDLVTATSIAGYTAQALTRVELLQHRISVAHELQQAMLTDLPPVTGLVLGARYEPADEREDVGGDWYDVITLPGSGPPGLTPVAVSVGDIVGHDVHAATIMGQARAMLRQASWTTACVSPAQVITDFEEAATGVALDLTGTALLARLSPTGDESGQWEMTWSNAGHPPPVILLPDGTTTQLDEHDIMLGCGHLSTRPRGDHHITLPPGATVVLYTDGLVEQHDRDIDLGIAALRELLSTLRGRTPDEIVVTALKTLITDAHDDTVALAITLQTP